MTERATERQPTFPSIPAGSATPHMRMFLFRETALSYGLLLVVFISLLFIVGPDNYGDVYRYADDVVNYDTGRFAAGQNPLWEFGHLTWRPLVWMLWKIAHPLWNSWFADNPTLQVIAVMSGIDVVAAAGVVLLLYLLVRKVCRYWWQAFLVTLGFMFTNPFLNYMRSGTAYIPGLVLQLLGLLVLLQAIETPAPANRSAIWGGCLLASSALMWFISVLPIPGLLLTAVARHRKTLSGKDAEGVRRLNFLGRAIWADD